MSNNISAHIDENKPEGEVLSRNLQESLRELEKLRFSGLIKVKCNVDLIIRFDNPLFKRE